MTSCTTGCNEPIRTSGQNKQDRKDFTQGAGRGRLRTELLLTDEHGDVDIAHGARGATGDRPEAVGGRDLRPIGEEALQLLDEGRLNRSD